jgi:hypothetical protein
LAKTKIADAGAWSSKIIDISQDVPIYPVSDLSP